MKKVLATLIVLFVAIMCCSCGTAEKNTSGINLAEFEQISTGMNLDEVRTIVGGEGTKVSESRDELEDYIEFTTIYRFDGETTGYAEITFTKRSYKDILKMDFSDAEVTTKTQSDLS